METPWGKLSDFKNGDFNLIDEILRWDKHTIPEGFIAECLVEQILDRITDGQQIRRLRVHTSIAVTPGVWKYHAFVWTDETATDIIPYLDVLTRNYTVYVVRYDPKLREFFSTETPYVTGSGRLAYKPLQEILSKVTGSSPDFKKVPPPADSVRNTVRHNQAIWGFLSVLYRKDIFEIAVLPRIYINFGANLYFGRAWDVDRVYMVNKQVMVLEIKHKDPFPHSNPKHFGINKGSLALLENICAGGARCYHLVLVKPVWDKEVSSMYLLGNLEAREKALLVGCEITKDKISRIKKGGMKQSGKNTSLTGKGTLDYLSIPVEDFHVIGSLSESVAVNASRVRDALTGVELPGLTVQELTRRRMRL